MEQSEGCLKYIIFGEDRVWKYPTSLFLLIWGFSLQNVPLKDIESYFKPKGGLILFFLYYQNGHFFPKKEIELLPVGPTIGVL